MRQIILIATILFTIAVNSQNKKRKFRPLLWTQHEKNVDVFGLSVGFYPAGHQDNHLTKTFGIRTEIFPLSFLYFLAPKTPLSKNDKQFKKALEIHPTQKIYGLNISTGTFESIDAHGISITGFMHYSRKNNGIAIAGLSNSIEKANGLIIGFGGNGIYKGNGIMIAGPWGNHVKDFTGIQISFDNTIYEKGSGIQIGLWNRAENFKGIQIGLWNKNEKRSLPIINWNF